MTTLLDRIRLGIAAFREGYLTSSVVDTDDWSDLDARRLRYQVLWAWYEQTAYRDVHNWATAYRKDYSLYEYIRPVYNPAWRLGEFWKAHLFGGLLDPEAGEEGAIPVATDNEVLRPAIAELWKWSRWQVRKDVLAVRGTVLGDVALQVVDDVARGRVYLDLLHPGLLESVDKDPFGNVKGYVIAETRPDPRQKVRSVEYREDVTRSGDLVIYETFLNGEPYAWPENMDRSGEPVSRWSEPYGFVPLVVVQHNDVGLEWGWSELHPVRAKVHEADDIASMISDQVRRTVKPEWKVMGARAPVETSRTSPGATADSDRPMPGREEMVLHYFGRDVKVEPMIANLDLASAILHLDKVLAEIERDVLELSQDIHTASGSASGRALRTARQPVVSKVLQRRSNYDAAVVAAQQMAIAIGGWRGYEEYSGFNLDSYTAGDLDHSIADRSVFEEDPLDKTEIDIAFWQAGEQAVKAGIPLEAYLREAGWDSERIAALEIGETNPQREEQEPPLRGDVAP